MSVTVKDVSGIIALAAIGIGVVWYVKNKAGGAISAINPANPNNVIHKTVENAVGADKLQSVSEKYFAFNDLLNPWNESDDYAREVLLGGLDFNFDLPEWAILNVDRINPGSRENFVYKGVQNLVGEKNLDTAGDYFFGFLDLINPFNKDDSYARTVYGLDEDSRILKNQNAEGIKE